MTRLEVRLLHWSVGGRVDHGPVYLPPFDPPPRVIMWSGRRFQFVGSWHKGKVEYRLIDGGQNKKGDDRDGD